ncbi:MAG: Na/Pi symporter [Bacteroidales bacterium]|nr:Na/Pi symporter [Bacteroidales bacterium]
MILTIFKLLGSIALLMYGMKVMSEALQKMAGPGLRHILGAMTTNRFTGVLTGMLVCVAVQSSAATTVMTVSFVNAALLSLSQAISVIMGANIGTTLSAWIMSAGFSFNIANLVWPVFLVAVILIQNRKHRYLGDFLFGLSFMFFALGTLNMTGREMDLAHNEGVVNFFSSFDSGSYLTILLFLLVGGVLTVIAQSSAALMAITMVLCTSGVLTIYQGIALVMGENIGTTVTANVAALSANTQARRAALAHLLFNVFGVLWVLCLFYPFVNAACSIVGVDPHADSQSPARLSFVLATFHTMFNVTNTAILIWFIPQLEKLVSYLIPQKSTDEEFRLQYIQTGIMKTPEISVLQAQKETTLFADRMRQMFSLVRELYAETDESAFEKKIARVREMEQMSDRLESEIGSYLAQVSNSHLSDETKRKIRAMLRAVSELESIGDSCLNLSRMIERRHKEKEQFLPVQEEGIAAMFNLLDQAFANMIKVLEGEGDPDDSWALENDIDELRDKLRSQNTLDVDAGKYSFALGTIFVDIVRECEKCGDYVINAVEAKMGKREDADLLNLDALVIDHKRKSVQLYGEPLDLSKAEFELLSLLVSNPGRVFTREELMDSVWPKDTAVSSKIVDLSIREIRSKLGDLSNRIMSKPGFGYYFE